MTGDKINHLCPVDFTQQISIVITKVNLDIGGIFKHIRLQTIINIKELKFINNGLTTSYPRGHGKENVIVHVINMTLATAGVQSVSWPLSGLPLSAKRLRGGQIC